MRCIQKIKFFDKSVWIEANEQFVISVSLVDNAKLVNPNQVTNEVAAWLKEYENGNFTPFDQKLINFDLGTKTNMVYKQLLKVHNGTIITYKDLSTKAGLNNAYRFAGSCMSKNNLPILIPCHRVLKNDLSIGQYSFGGPDFKKTLLMHEIFFGFK